MIKRILEFINARLSFIFIGAFIILSTLFFFMFWYEAITGIPTKSVEIWENRTLAKLPDFNKTPWKDYPQGISSYLSDNMPLRTQMIRFYRRLWADCLPPLLNPVIKGEDGHRFARMTILNYQGYTLLPISKLRSKKVLLIGLSRFWELEGAEFYSLFVPDKPSVYRDMLGDWVGESRGWSKQITDYFADLDKYGVKFVDLTPVLIKNRDRGLLYNKESDLLHWNGNGLAVTYDYLVDELGDNPAFAAEARVKAFEIVGREMETDTSRLEVVPWMVLNKEGLELVEHDYLPDSKIWVGVDIVLNKRVDKGTLLFMTDSCIKKSHQDKFGSSHASIFPTVHHVNKQINSHAGSASFEFYTELAENEKPDIVIDEFVEWLGLDTGSYNDFKKRFYLAGSAILDEKKLLIDPDIMKSYGTAEAGGGLRIGEDGAGLKVTLPETAADSEGILVVAAKIESAADTEVVLRYSQNEDKRVKPEELKRVLKKGIDYLYIQLAGEADKKFSLELEFMGGGGGQVILPFPENADEFLEEGVDGI